MRTVLVVLALAAAAHAIVLPTQDLDAVFTQFQAFTHKFNRTYDSPAEYESRFLIFQNNVARMLQLRAEHEAATGEPADTIFGITKFMDLTSEEMSMYKGFKPHPRISDVHVRANVLSSSRIGVPTSFDWRKEGKVTPVKNQAQCGSCWAFSATEEIESMWAVQGNKLEELSEQQIVSCDTVDYGCDGGDTPTAYEYVQKAGGLELNSAYPYTSGGGNTGSCKFKKAEIKVNVKNYSYATNPCTGSCNSQDEKTMQANLASVGPISICVNANDAWQMYTSGVLASGCPHAYSDLDHCVQAVGYNAEGSKPYWIVRNSWDTDWGEDGYIYIEMGKNLCGVADEATVVYTVAAVPSN